MTTDWIEFAKEKPEKKKRILVTNNITARNAYGEMSHLWLTNFWTESSDDPNEIVSFDEADRKLRNLTHWKYAPV